MDCKKKATCKMNCTFHAFFHVKANCLQENQALHWFRFWQNILLSLESQWLQDLYLLIGEASIKKTRYWKLQIIKETFYHLSQQIFLRQTLLATLFSPQNLIASYTQSDRSSQILLTWEHTTMDTSICMDSKHSQT